MEIECGVEDGVERPPSLSSSLTLSSRFSIKVVSVMRRKFYKWGERLHSVVTLNFNVAHGHVYSEPSQYLIQQLERLWGATENIITRASPLSLFILFYPPPPLSSFTLTVYRFTLSCFSDISGDNSRLFLTLWRDSALLKRPCFFFFFIHMCFIKWRFMPSEVHTQLHFHLYAKIDWTLDCTYTATHSHDTHTHTKPPKKNTLSKLFQVSICPFPSKWVENGGAGAK